jgi:hypothetical protein
VQGLVISDSLRAEIVSSGLGLAKAFSARDHLLTWKWEVGEGHWGPGRGSYLILYHQADEMQVTALPDHPDLHQL